MKRKGHKTKCCDKNKDFILLVSNANFNFFITLNQHYINFMFVILTYILIFKIDFLNSCLTNK